MQVASRPSQNTSFSYENSTERLSNIPVCRGLPDRAKQAFAKAIHLLPTTCWPDLSTHLLLGRLPELKRILCQGLRAPPGNPKCLLFRVGRNLWTEGMSNMRPRCIAALISKACFSCFESSAKRLVGDMLVVAKKSWCSSMMQYWAGPWGALGCCKSRAVDQTGKFEVCIMYGQY